MDRHQACQRLPDAVWGVTDVDHGERILTDDLETAGPARIAQASADRGLDPLWCLARLLALQPQQKKRDGDGRVVELKRTGQVHFEAAKIMIPELEIEMLA